METLQQRMAMKALQNVKAYKDEHSAEADRKKYGSMAHKLPILIHSAGLAQALAFIEARDVAPHKTLLDHVAQTLEMPGIENASQLADRSHRAPLSEYMLLTRRALAALLWYKRFAESVLDVKLKDAARIDDAGEETPAGEEAANVQT